MIIMARTYIHGSDYETKDGTCIRDYVHVSDLANAHVLGANYLLAENKSFIINLGSNDGYSVKEIIEAAEKIYPIKYEMSKRREGDPAKLIASNNKAKELLGWGPKYDLFDIINSDIEYRKRLVKK